MTMDKILGPQEIMSFFFHI